ncbi:MAG: hypothetical protein K2H14_06665 [Muribaculaceae bacterium]|nr:hypothetical protein [Muribaculaceae bacterium]
MKIKTLLLTLLLAVSKLAAQNQPYRPFQISFVYPLGTNGLSAKEYSNGVSLNLLAGLSKNDKYLSLAGLSNIITNNATGMQLAGITNYIGGIGTGCAIAGISNITFSSYRGFQLSGIFSISGSGSKGFMLGGIANYTKGNFDGMQLAGIANIAGDVHGLQFAGIINKAKKVKGVQFAGILNIAEESDIPIGLVNIIKKGELGLALTYDLSGNTMVSFRSGGKYTYGILGIGVNHNMTKNKGVAECGYGIHIPVTKWFRIDNEFKGHTSLVTTETDKSNYHLGYLLAPSFKMWNHFNIFGGASINYLYSDSNISESIAPRRTLWSKTSEANEQHMYIGYEVGVQYIF